MVFKINISDKSGKTYHFETESESLVGKELKQKFLGNEILPDLAGYEFEITGGSGNSGMPMLPNVEGMIKQRVLLSYETGMHRRSRREGKKPRSNFTPKGLRLRKTVKGKIISQDTAQINLKVLKQGNKKLSEIWPEQCKPKEKSEKK